MEAADRKKQEDERKALIMATVISGECVHLPYRDQSSRKHLFRFLSTVKQQYMIWMSEYNIYYLYI